jgi:PAS domain S-box-containing protein
MRNPENTPKPSGGYTGIFHNMGVPFSIMNEQAQYLLASIVESSQDSIVTIDLNRLVTSWNKGAERMYGYKAEEIVGKPLAVVMLPADILNLITAVEHIVGEITVPVYETIRHHKNGRETELEIMLSPVRSVTGTVVGISTIARDITARKMQEQQKDEFIAIASHELKTPATSIKAYTQLLLAQFEESADEVTAAMVKRLSGQVDKMINLIGTLLDTARLRAGEILLKIEDLDLNAVITEHLDGVNRLSSSHRITFLPGSIQLVPADRKLVEQILTNLLSNAIKYSPTGGEIVIATGESGSGAQISIQDFGVGVPASEKDKIFDRYFRVSNPLTTNSPGIGLGLYITAGIVKQHGGAIAVESIEGSGSTFFVTLPYERVSAKALPPQSAGSVNG